MKRCTNAVILAAGEGTRLRPYTATVPKCLVEVNHRSLLDRQLEVLKSVGVTEITVIGGYLSDRLRSLHYDVEINPDYAQTNMVWTLFCAEEKIKNGGILSYGDIVYSQAIVRKLLDSTCDIAVIIDKSWRSYWEARSDNPIEDAETLRLGSNNEIIEIGQKPSSMDEIEGQYIGLLKLSSEGAKIFSDIFREAQTNGMLDEKPLKKAYMTDLIQAAINRGHRVNAILSTEPWVEVDSVDDLHLPTTLNRLNYIESTIK